MDQTPLVEMLVEDGKRLIDRLVEEGVGVTAACWLANVEEGKWFLYLATPLVDDDGATREAYRRVHSVLRGIPRPFWIDPFDVKVVSPKDPIALAVQELH